ncbi:MAG TPA: sugar ABC transporter permease [Treponema sp.]|nr:sugar ABC transporter permease [Treponema sp.]
MENTQHYASQSRRLAVRRPFCYAVLIILAALSIFPFLVLIVNSTRLHSSIQTTFTLVPSTNFGANWTKLISNPNMPILRSLFNSIYVSMLTAILSTYFSAMTAYGIYMYRFKARNIAFKFIMLVMMVPGQVSACGFIRLMAKLHLMDNLAALYIPAIASPVVFFYMYQAMEATLPTSIVEAARVDGCNELRTFNEIVLPMMKPAIAVQAIFSFVGSWNNYFLPALLISKKENKTVPIMIAQLRSADYQNFDLGTVYMQVCIAIIPLLIVYLLLSRFIISGATAGGVKE